MAPVIPAATARGLSIPSDLSVIGFDNVPESALTTPPLTTVEQPIRQMGVEAVHILRALLEDDAGAPAGGAAHAAHRAPLLPAALNRVGSPAAIIQA